MEKLLFSSGTLPGARWSNGKKYVAGIGESGTSDWPGRKQMTSRVSH